MEDKGLRLLGRENIIKHKATLIIEVVDLLGITLGLAYPQVIRSVYPVRDLRALFASLTKISW